MAGLVLENGDPTQVAKVVPGAETFMAITGEDQERVTSLHQQPMFLSRKQHRMPILIKESLDLYLHQWSALRILSMVLI